MRILLARDFPELDMRQVRIVLIEAHDRLLGAFPRSLGEDAARRLTRRGVTVRLDTMVGRVAGEAISLAGPETLLARTLVWAAGVKPGGLAQRLALPRTKSGRISVDAYLRVEGHERVFAIGDIAAVPFRGSEMPMLSAPAMQQGRRVARNILRAARGEDPRGQRRGQHGPRRARVATHDGRIVQLPEDLADPEGQLGRDLDVRETADSRGAKARHRPG